MPIELSAGYAVATIDTAVGIIFPSLVLSGGFYVTWNGIVRPIPNGIYETEGMYASVAIMTLRQSASLAGDSETGGALSVAADNIATAAAGHIDRFLKELEKRVARIMEH